MTFRLSRQIGRPPLLLLAFAVVLGGCNSSDDFDNSAETESFAPQAAAELVPVVAGSPETRSTPFMAWPFDLSAQGYIEEEYLLSGTGNIYDYLDDAGQSPEVVVAGADIPYTTRFLVRRPENPALFNGTVIVELLNPSLGHDVDYIWQYSYNALMNDGAIWVGVTGTATTVGFLRDLWGQQDPNFVRNNSRYGTLQLDSDGQAWDMLTQLGELLKAGDVATNPLADYRVERNILVSFSRTAENVVSYAVSFHKDALTPLGDPVYDGYFASAGTAFGKRINPADNSEAEQRQQPGDPRSLFPGDVPSMRYQTQTELLPGFAVETARQDADEYPLVRTYEVAGAAHIDAESDALGQPFLERDLNRSSYFPDGFCPPVINTPLRQSGSNSALLIALDRWVRAGAAPPPSAFISLLDDGSGNLSLDFDADGNVRGGVRPPTLDVPAGVYMTRPVPFAPCFLLGDYAAFDAATMIDKYGDAETFLAEMQARVDAAIADGYLLPYDGEVVMTDAALAAGVFP